MQSALFCLVSVAEQAGLSLNLVVNSKDVFLPRGPKNIANACKCALNLEVIKY